MPSDKQLVVIGCQKHTSRLNDFERLCRCALKDSMLAQELPNWKLIWFDQARAEKGCCGCAQVAYTDKSTLVYRVDVVDTTKRRIGSAEIVDRVAWINQVYDFGKQHNKACLEKESKVVRAARIFVHELGHMLLNSKNENTGTDTSIMRRENDSKFENGEYSSCAAYQFSSDELINIGQVASKSTSERMLTLLPRHIDEMEGSTLFESQKQSQIFQFGGQNMDALLSVYLDLAHIRSKFSGVIEHANPVGEGCCTSDEPSYIVRIRKRGQSLSEPGQLYPAISMDRNGLVEILLNVGMEGGHIASPGGYVANVIVLWRGQAVEITGIDITIQRPEGVGIWWSIAGQKQQHSLRYEYLISEVLKRKCPDCTGPIADLVNRRLGSIDTNIQQFVDSQIEQKETELQQLRDSVLQ